MESAHDGVDPDLDRRRELEAARIRQLLANGDQLLDEARRTLASLDDALMESRRGSTPPH